MSTRVAYKPISIPAGVDVKIENDYVTVKGPKGELTEKLANGISANCADKELSIKIQEGLENGFALGGTMRALLNNQVVGVSQGFEKKLRLVGVGYRAQVGKSGQQSVLKLTLGLSHPVEYEVPEGITIETPSATDIVVKGINKQKVGQAAANIRNIRKGIRKPEPYKGKGIRYDDEHISLKETKKK